MREKVFWRTSHTGVQKSHCLFKSEQCCAGMQPATQVSWCAPALQWSPHKKSYRLWRIPLLLLAPAGTDNVIPPLGSSGVTCEEEEVWWSWKKGL